jgi:hypothetical protein
VEKRNQFREWSTAFNFRMKNLYADIMTQVQFEKKRDRKKNRAMRGQGMNDTMMSGFSTFRSALGDETSRTDLHE